MEKTISRWSYWLGVSCVIIAIAWKGGNAFGLWRALPPTPADISYWSFFNASLLFFATSIASTCRVWLKSVAKDKDTAAKIRSAREADLVEPQARRQPKHTSSWDVFVSPEENDGSDKQRSA